MTDPRRLALQLLCRYEEEKRYVNLSLPKEHPQKAFLTALFYGTVEHLLTFDYYISSLAGKTKVDPYTRNVLRLGMQQILYMDTPEHVAVSETVKLARNKGEAGFVNALLRETVRKKENLPLPPREKHALRHLSVKYSVALPLVRTLFAALESEEETEAFLSAISKKAPTSLTVNTCKTSVNDFIKSLEAQGLEVQKAPFTSRGVWLHSPTPIPAIKGYKEGHFFVQDEAARLAVEVLSPKKGDTVVDVCAAPGGKTFCAAVCAEGEGEFYAFDLHESKLPLICDSAKRLGFTVHTKAHDSTQADPTLTEKADCVICDVPCSGMGVLGKKPDMRYKSTETFSALPALQGQILEQAFTYLKKGGRLLYATCTVIQEENEGVVESFLSAHENARLLPFKIGELESQNGMLTLYPHRHQTDGFFIALLERT